MKEIKKNNSYSAEGKNSQNKKKGKKIIALLTLLILVMGALQINAAWAQTTGTEAEDDMGSEMDTEEVIAVTDIEIADHEPVVAVGDTISLEAMVIPENATESTVKYTSSDTSIATVSSRGEVKGIKKGTVTITASAGEIKKDVAITVKVATTAIKVNQDYIVLKLGGTYRLTAKVLPSEADQAIRYSCVDTTVATVSDTGLVTARAKGSTAIMVSNEDMVVAVSLIVNEDVKGGDSQDPGNPESSVEPKRKIYDYVIFATEKDSVDTETLSHLYASKGALKIEGKGYILEVDGKDIVNYENILYTDISLKRNGEEVSFNLNKGEALCGPVTLYIDNPVGKYLYLYNEAKEKYQLIEADDLHKLELTTPGQYKIIQKKMRSDMTTTLYILAGGMVALVIGSVVYIVVKRKYWFW